MKTFLCFTFITMLAYACSPKIGSKIASKQVPLSDTDFVVILQQQDAFKNDGIEVGSIRSGDNGFSTNCTYSEIIDKLKQLAKQNGANIIRITKHKNPDFWSTCVRLKAKIYRVPDFRKHEKEIVWTANRKLTWEDFKGSPQAISNTAAETYCGFGFQTNRITIYTGAKIFTSNTFNTHLSWVRPDQKERTDLLEHEQGHFDLCEVYTRQLRKKLEEKKLTAFNARSYSETVFKEVYDLYINRQGLYEKETSHGLDRQKQREWMAAINSELNSLSSYTK